MHVLLYMDILKAIPAIREGKGIKQIEIATRLGIEQSNYSRLEKRGNKLAIDQLQAIADALSVTVLDILIWGEDKSEPRGDDAGQEIQQLKKRVEELESSLSDKNFILTNIKLLINSRLFTIFYNVVSEYKLGTIKFEDEEGKQITVPYASLDSQAIPDNYDFELSNEEQQQVYKLMFSRQEYFDEATFLISTGFADDDKIIQSFKKYAPDPFLNRKAINPFQRAFLKKSDHSANEPFEDGSRSIEHK